MVSDEGPLYIEPVLGPSAEPTIDLVISLAVIARARGTRHSGSMRLYPAHRQARGRHRLGLAHFW